MKKLAFALTAIFFAHAAFADAEVGKPAPDFSAAAASGKTVSLSQYKGKIVVLEWSNPGCPFVHKFYDAGAMQALQKEETAKGVVWLTVNSSAAGKEGSLDAEGAKAFIAAKRAAPTEYLLDADGKVGHLYGAKTTPHMFVIGSDGVLAYAGAMDDKPTPFADDLKTAHNYVSAAIDALMSGTKPPITSTQSYGCSVKY